MKTYFVLGLALSVAVGSVGHCSSARQPYLLDKTQGFVSQKRITFDGEAQFEVRGNLVLVQSLNRADNVKSFHIYRTPSFEEIWQTTDDHGLLTRESIGSKTAVLNEPIKECVFTSRIVNYVSGDEIETRHLDTPLMASSSSNFYYALPNLYCPKSLAVLDSNGMMNFYSAVSYPVSEIHQLGDSLLIYVGDAMDTVVAINALSGDVVAQLGTPLSDRHSRFGPVVRVANGGDLVLVVWEVLRRFMTKS